MVVVNYDTIYREAMLTWISDRKWAAIICDESHRIKSYSGKQSKALHRLSVKTGRRLCLTGTPIPHSPLDLFGQFRFLDAKVFGTSYTRFRSRYAVTNPMFPSQVRRWTNLEELNEKFYSRAHRVLASEVLDLPPKIDTIVPVQLGTKGRRIYESLKNDLIAEIETAGGPAMVSAQNALVKLLRLQQITGGCITAPDLSGVEQVDWAKQDALTDLLDDMGADERVVVFCRFRADIDSVKEVATKLGRPFGELSGRANDLDGNQMPETPGLIMAVQIASGGAGVDLTRSSACVYWSLGFSLGEFEQSVARLHRPGQTRPVRYWHLIAEDTVDESVYHALQNRREVVEQVLGGLS